MSTPNLVKYVKVSNLLEGRRYLIEWQLNSETNIDHYNIYRSEANYAGFEKVGETNANDNQFVDVVPKVWGITWFYKVTAVNNAPTPEESDLESSFPASVIDVSGFSQEAFLDNLTPGDFVSQEEPIGDKNGSNINFRTKYAYIPGSVDLYIDRVPLVRGVDYTEEGTVAIKLAGDYAVTPPDSTAIMRVSYIKA